MSKQDLNDSSLDLGYGAVPPNYDNMNYSYSGGADTITIDTSNMFNTNTITLPSTTINSGYTIGGGSNYYTTGYNTSTVNISSDGIDMAAGTDIKVDGKSLKEFMNKMEERLAILVPDPKKLEQFAALKKAYEHYKLMEKLCQEPPKED